LILLATVFSFIGVGFALAATGIIDSTFKYAFADKIGWINFAPTDSGQKYVGLNITDSAVTGYAWSQNFAWINFKPTNGGVTNNTNGNLSGYAFGENTGWINFGGVNIDCEGKFTGAATGDIVGTINFNCANCVVKTNWLPVSCEQQKTHNECNNQGQCLPVTGAGTSRCQTDSDCVDIIPIIPEVPPTTIIDNVKIAIKEVKKIIEKPQVSIATKVISTTGVAEGAVAAVLVVAASPFSLLEIFLFPIKFLGILLAAFGIRKRILPWGIVYDSVTKQPLDPAYVILKDLQGKDLVSAITDIDGRYGFLVQPGLYNIASRKTNYAFPSEKLIGKRQDEIYDNLYFGEQIEIKKTGEVIIKNIPLDPVKFDWNEFVKKNKTFMKFYSRWDLILRKISDLFFVVGFFIAIVAFIFAPYPYNTIIFVMYLLVLLLRILGLKPKAFGYVVEKITGNPLSFAIIRIIMPSTNVEISHRITDAYGRYYCLIPRGKYYVKIEKKNDDGSYSLVHTSPIIDASKKGIIKKKFEI